MTLNVFSFLFSFQAEECIKRRPRVLLTILSISKRDGSEGTASGGGSFSLEDGGDGFKLWLQAAKALSRGGAFIEDARA